MLTFDRAVIYKKKRLDQLIAAAYKEVSSTAVVQYRVEDISSFVKVFITGSECFTVPVHSLYLSIVEEKQHGKRIMQIYQLNEYSV